MSIGIDTLETRLAELVESKKELSEHIAILSAEKDRVVSQIEDSRANLQAHCGIIGELERMIDSSTPDLSSELDIKDTP